MALIRSARWTTVDQTLKITNVLSDPTRYYIYQHIAKRHSEVTVQEIAEIFEIHPNVARLHLTKLEDVNMLVSETKKTGKGGRPSRLYRLSDDVIQLNFPYRDYQLLSKIALQTMFALGEAGKEALFNTGRLFGKELAEQHLKGAGESRDSLSFDHKLSIIKDASTTAGFYPEFVTAEDHSAIYFRIHNCPFKEIAFEQKEAVCGMHHEFLRGMFSVLFDSIELIEEENMFDRADCHACTYRMLSAN